jgi:hypothetical protein
LNEKSGEKSRWDLANKKKYLVKETKKRRKERKDGKKGRQKGG